jgi:hypothetical protein
MPNDVLPPCNSPVPPAHPTTLIMRCGRFYWLQSRACRAAPKQVRAMIGYGTRRKFGLV